jgi:hypothetical protein
MTERLAQIRQRCEAATPGPWLGDTIRGYIKYEMRGPGGELVLAVNHKEGNFGFIGANKIADRTFVLHSRADIEWLLDRVDSLMAGQDEERARLEHAVAEAALAESAIELPQYSAIAGRTPEREAVERAWSAAMDRYNEAVKALRDHIARKDQGATRDEQ